MPRRSASVTQADISRMIRAAQQCGLTITRLVVRADGVSVETAPDTGSNPAAMLGAARSAARESHTDNAPPVDHLQGYYDRLGFDPKTMDQSDMKRLQEETHARWLAEVVLAPLNKREQHALQQFAGVQAYEIVREHSIKGLGIDTSQRLEARGFIEPRYSTKFPDRIDRWMLTDAGAEAVAAVLTGQEPLRPPR